MAWHELTQDYFLGRPTLAHVLLLVDACMEPNSMDVDAALWLTQHSVPYSLVFTKVCTRHACSRGLGHQTALRSMYSNIRPPTNSCCSIAIVCVVHLCHAGIYIR